MATPPPPPRLLKPRYKEGSLLILGRQARLYTTASTFQFNPPPIHYKHLEERPYFAYSSAFSTFFLYPFDPSYCRRSGLFIYYLISCSFLYCTFSLFSSPFPSGCKFTGSTLASLVDL